MNCLLRHETLTSAQLLIKTYYIGGGGGGGGRHRMTE